MKKKNENTFTSTRKIFACTLITEISPPGRNHFILWHTPSGFCYVERLIINDGRAFWSFCEISPLQGIEPESILLSLSLSLSARTQKGFYNETAVKKFSGIWADKNYANARGELKLSNAFFCLLNPDTVAICHFLPYFYFRMSFIYTFPFSIVFCIFRTFSVSICKFVNHMINEKEVRQLKKYYGFQFLCWVNIFWEMWCHIWI